MVVTTVLRPDRRSESKLSARGYGRTCVPAGVSAGALTHHSLPARPAPGGFSPPRPADPEDASVLLAKPDREVILGRGFRLLGQQAMPVDHR